MIPWSVFKKKKKERTLRFSCGILTSGDDMTVTHVESLQLQLSTQDLHTIKTQDSQNSSMDGVGRGLRPHPREVGIGCR